MKRNVQKLTADKFTPKSQIDLAKTKVIGGAGKKQDSGSVDILIGDL